MPDIAEDLGLAIKARRLSALARAKSQDEQESQGQVQIETSLDRLDAALAGLSSALATYKKLKAVGAPVNDPEDLLRPPARLREHLETIGRPTPQFLNARTRDALSARTAVASENLRAWRTWADTAVETLPLNLLPRLSITIRSATESRVSKMRKLAATAPTAPSDVSEFVMLREHVREDLSDVQGSAVDAVLARLTNGRIRLADLSDDEIALLRSEPSIASQLFVQLS